MGSGPVRAVRWARRGPLRAVAQNYTGTYCAREAPGCVSFPANFIRRSGLLGGATPPAPHPGGGNAPTPAEEPGLVGSGGPPLRVPGGGGCAGGWHAPSRPFSTRPPCGGRRGPAARLSWSSPPCPPLSTPCPSRQGYAKPPGPLPRRP